MRYSKKKIFSVAVALIVLAVACVVAWQLVPSSADAMRGSAVVVEQTSWQEIRIDGKPRLYFSGCMGDSTLLGVTANRDSAAHHRRMAGCWINRWSLLPSCMGRIATVYSAAPAVPRLGADSCIVRMCRQSIATQLKTLKTQKSELDYYLRVHGVQDNGYQAIAALASRVNAAYADVSRAGRVLDSLTASGRHRLAVASATEYVAVYRGTDGKTLRTRLDRIGADPSARMMTLQTVDGKTPDSASPLSVTPWVMSHRRGILAVGFPGLGENGLECDTVSPVIMPGTWSADGSHDLPRLLVSDGSPVFTKKGRFIGIVSGNSILRHVKTH